MPNTHRPTLEKNQPLFSFLFFFPGDRTFGFNFREENNRSPRFGNSMASSQQPSLNPDDKKQDYSFLRALEAFSLPWITMALDSVWDVGVFDVLAKSGGAEKLSAKDIAAGLRIENPTAPALLDKLLKLLACYGFVGCSLGSADERLYSLNSVSKYFVPDQSGASLRPIRTIYREEAFWAAMGEYKNAIVEGGLPFNRAHGTPFYEYNKKDQRFSEVFDESICSRTIFIMRVILEGYDGFKDLSCLVDVGGGVGVAVGMITSKYPSLKGINFDLPHVIHNAPSYPGVEHIGGDMFESVPRGDAILLKSVMHNWGDDDCVKILNKCHDSIPDNGKLIIVERIPPILPDASEFTKDSCMFDVIMSTLFSGGQERTLEQYKALATQAGFNETIGFQNFPTCGFCVIEFFK